MTDTVTEFGELLVCIAGLAALCLVIWGFNAYRARRAEQHHVDQLLAERHRALAQRKAAQEARRERKGPR